MKKLIYKIWFVTLTSHFYVNAAWAVDSYVYMNNNFHKNISCQRLAIRFPPYYVLNTDLSNTNNFLRRGSFIDYKKDKIIRSWNIQTESTVNAPLKDQFLDSPDLWNIKVLSTHKDIPQLSLVNKTLALQKTPDGRMTVNRCCQGNSCELLPIYQVLENQKQLAELSFHPKKSQFLNSYSLSKGNQALTAPRLFAPISTPSASVVPSSIPYDEEDDEDHDEDSDTSLKQNIVCTKKDPLRIYDDSMQKVLYNIQRFQAIRVFQNWDGGREEKQVGRTTYIKVQAHNARGEEIIGWAAASYIKSPANCPGFSLVGSPSGETLIEGSTIVVDTNSGNYRFPTQSPPTSDYSHGAGGRYFGAGRSGRKHAACDLLRPSGEKVFAVSNGKVIRRYYFYKGTDAIEVQHDDGKVMRYGEVSKKIVPQSVDGDRILKGQHIGYIGGLKMLHFEMYSGKASGPLTVRGANAYSRRSDLLDPTKYLKTWEESTF